MFGWWVSGSPSEFARPMSSPLSSTTIASASEPVVGIAAGALAAAPEVEVVLLGAAGAPEAAPSAGASSGAT